MLLRDNVAANLPRGARLVSNDFRNQRLYNEEVDLLLKRHAVMLKALYSRWVVWLSLNADGVCMYLCVYYVVWLL